MRAAGRPWCAPTHEVMEEVAEGESAVASAVFNNLDATQLAIMKKVKKRSG